MVIKLRTEQAARIGMITLNKCFKCSYILDFDWFDTGFESYDLSTIEDSENIVRRLKEAGFTEIKVIPNKLQSKTPIK